mgnify:CR=1 FL=1
MFMRVFFVLIFGVFLAASIQAQAQPLFPHANSIETTVANADLVFIGTIARFQSLEHGDAPKGRDVGMVIWGRDGKDTTTPAAISF